MKKQTILLLLIVLFSFILRLVIAFQSDYFADDDAYSNLRLIEMIKEKKSLVTYDPLSYGGRDIIRPQLFHGVMALLSFIPFSLKLLPEVFISALPIIVYLISLELTKDKNSSVITAFISSFIPIVFSSTVNQISVYSFVLPLMLLMFYSLLRINDTRFLIFFIVMSFVMPWIHPSAFVFIISLLFYIVLMVSESMSLSGIRKEAITFSFFSMLLVSMILFRRVFLQYGTSIVRQNIPDLAFDYYFSNFSLSSSLLIVGVIPLVFGIFGVYYGLHGRRKKDVLLLISPILATFLLLLLKMIDISSGILFLGVFLTLMTSFSIRRLLNYFSITKLSRYYSPFVAVFIVVIAVLGVVPSIYYYENELEGKYNVDDLKFIAEAEENNAVVLSSFDEGNIVSYFTGKKNFVDTNFLLAPSPIQRLGDAEVVYKTFSESKALEIMKRHNIKYILISENTKQTYGIDKLLYVGDLSCFKHERETIYKVVC